MIRLFDLEDGELVPTIHCTSIEWLRDIMVSFPKSYMKVYRYIFYMTCPSEDLNPYRNMPEADRSEEIMRMLAAGEPLDFIADDLKIEKAIIECRKLYTTPTTEVYLAAKGMLEKLKKSFQTEELTWGGKDATGPAMVAAMEKLPKLLEAYNSAELKMNEEAKSRARGNQMMSYDLDDL